MQKTIFFVFLIITFASCGGETPPAGGDTIAQKDPSAQKTGGQFESADTKMADYAPTPEERKEVEERSKRDYADLLVGEWEAVSDASWRILVKDGQIFQFKGDQFTSSEKFTVELDCKFDSCFGEIYWCIKGEKNCYSVKGANRKYLNIFTSNDGDGSLTKFVRL